MAIVSIALALSLAGNAGLGWLYLDKRDELATTEADLSHAEGEAKSCSDSVAKLGQLSITRAADAAVARALAAASAATGYQKADEILSTGPSTPGDDCKSAKDRKASWLKGRK